MLQPLLIRLDELSKLSTQGEWYYDGICYLFTKEADGNNQMLADTGEDGDDTRMRGVGANLPLETNARFIAELKNAYPLLRAEIERLQEVERKKDEAEKLGKISGLELAQACLRLSYMANGITWGRNKKCKELFELLESSLSEKLKEAKTQV